MITKRNWDILNVLITGASDKEIAQEVGIATRTVKQHVMHMMQKLAVPNRIELALLALNVSVPETISHPELVTNPKLCIVAGLIARGRTNREIAATLGTTEQVIKNYCRRIYDIFGVWSRLELAIMLAVPGGSDVREKEVRVEDSGVSSEGRDYRELEQEETGSGGVSSVSLPDMQFAD